MINKVDLVAKLKWYLSLLTFFISDECYCRILYFIKNRKPLNLSNPRSFSESLYAFKLSEEMNHYCKNVDKYSVREYVKDVICEKYLNGLL